MVTLIKGIIMAESTKERILRTALELFAQNGYLGTSMNDIAGQFKKFAHTALPSLIIGQRNRFPPISVKC